jgi:2-methylcitrate dehydratase
VALWHKVRTGEDLDWTRRYHDPDPARRAFGGRLDIVLDDGTVLLGDPTVFNADISTISTSRPSNSTEVPA